MAKTSPNLSELQMSYLLIVIKIHQIASPTQKSQKSSKIVKIGILQVIACEYWILSGHGLILWIWTALSWFSCHFWGSVSVFKLNLVHLDILINKYHRSVHVICAFWMVYQVFWWFLANFVDFGIGFTIVVCDFWNFWLTASHGSHVFSFWLLLISIANFRNFQKNETFDRFGPDFDVL